ncbi:hypothetical protein SZ64_13760 [Erythrobacter sp. SG61-1L]|uniref:hypothetical protein n=1 Tax=Erythrobacter sp. SG61-1L TaxID=1603897 RepID=UPI0006C927AF|nr:hypothetical protein [Erythrobacter sp. SG61-1L]KPL69075.1 hypothetical protein SZ64_13760 [Erythrobacter sp. SG61-1L]
MDDDGDQADGMVLLAILVSRVEAIVVTSMLEAGGIFANTGALNHASVEVNSLALGGHRIWVPASQYRLASDLLIEVLGENEWSFSPGLRRAVLRVAGAWAGVMIAATAALWALGGTSFVEIVFAPLSALTVPVNPQGRGDYFLHPLAG